MRMNHLPSRYMKFITLFLSLGIVTLCFAPAVFAQQDQLPIREYTNPDEMITFDRSTDFVRALDVINKFSQEYRGKVIIDRTGTGGSIGISVPPMHWKDALDLILNVKGLALVEREDFYEILTQQAAKPGQARTTTSAQPAGQQEELVATTDTREVRINAIFFEGNRRALQEIGVDWSTISEDVPDAVLGEESPTLPSTEFGDGPFVQVNQVGAQNVSQEVFNSIINFGAIGNTGIRVQALFSAFEADNLGEILASPTVKVMDGQEGRIQVGQDFSIKQRDFAGNVTDQFFSVGTILTVTPQIIEQNDTTFIHLTIQAERSSAQPDPVSTIINKQEANTQALLLDGEATVIAGLYRTETAEVRRGIPILKDLPAWFFGLKYLFGYNSNDYQMRELVILIQASIAPSIPQRYANRENQPSKFEVLSNERNRIRNEMLRQDDKAEDLIDMDTEEEPLEEDLMDRDVAEEAEQDSVQQQAPPQDEEEEEPKKMAEAEQDEPEEEVALGDPEVQTEAVPLNFGTEDEDSVAKEEQVVQTEQDTSSAVGEENMDLAQAEQDTMDTGEADMSPTEQQPSATGAGDFSYYIIGASFRVETNARQFHRGLIDEGFDALILRPDDSEFYMVAYRGYNELNSAKTALADIKQYQNDKAWLYRAK